MRLALLASLFLVLPTTFGIAGCESAVDRRTRESGLEMWAHPVDGSWMITFAGIRGYASDVVVRFGDGREETYRRPKFQLPPDIEGPIDIWLLEYELRGETISGPYRFHFDPQQAQIDNAKDALDMLGNEWFAWRRTGGKDVIYTTFVSRYTCGLARVEYGFGEEPDLELPLPPCKMSDLDFLADEMLESPADTHAHVVVQITFADGEKTSVHRIANPNYRTGATGPIPFNRALVTSSTDEAKLYLDGGYRCDTPCEVKVPVDGQPHELRLEKDGYQALVKSWTPKSVAEPAPSFGSMKVAGQK